MSNVSDVSTYALNLTKCLGINIYFIYLSVAATTDHTDSPFLISVFETHDLQSPNSFCHFSTDIYWRNISYSTWYKI